MPKNVTAKIIPHDGEVTIMVQVEGATEAEAFRSAEDRIVELIRANRSAIFRKSVMRKKGCVSYHCNARIRALGLNDNPTVNRGNKIEPYTAIWIRSSILPTKAHYVCSACGREIVSGKEMPDLHKYKYCSGCGARMKADPSGRLIPILPDPKPGEAYADWANRLRAGGLKISDPQLMAYWGKFVAEGFLPEGDQDE